MKIAAAQIECVVGDVPANIDKMVRFVADAKSAGCDAIVFPEMSDTGYSMRIILEKASVWTQGAAQILAETAKKHNINIIAGLSERDGKTVYNSAAVINRKGKIVAKYRKTHLITAEPVCEHKHLAAGEEIVLASIDDVAMGLMICYDNRFPELARALTNAGSKMIIVPAAFPLIRINHWKILNQARSIENQLFVVGANRVGTDEPGLPLGGSSQIIDPAGEILASASETEEKLITADLNLTLIDQVRSRVHIQEDRRPDLYVKPVKVLPL